MADGRKCGLTTSDLYALDLACTALHDALRALDGPAGVYLVGTAASSPTYRDVDVRAIVNDDAFDAMFPSIDWWSVVCHAIGAHLKAVTGLPIDFQVQRMTQANDKHPGPRNPLGMGARWLAGGGDATDFIRPYAPTAAPTTEREQ